MTPATVFYNATACGAVASATLCQSKAHEAAPAESAIEATPERAHLAPTSAARGWRRGFSVLADLVSGPSPVRA